MPIHDSEKFIVESAGFYKHLPCIETIEETPEPQVAELQPSALHVYLQLCGYGLFLAPLLLWRPRMTGMSLYC